MKILHYILLAMLFSITLSSCGLKKQVSVKEKYPPTTEVKIIQTNQYLPDNLIRIGSIVIGESGLTPEGKCTYEACMQVIETESMKAGANVVYLVRVVEPNLYSTCYDITADLYRYK